jgi:hypothetical protein
LTHRSGGHHRTLSLAAEGTLLSAFPFYGGDKMKTLTVLLAIGVLFTLTACGDDFDAEAEEDAVVSTVQAMFDDFAVPDVEALFTYFHEDWEDINVWPDFQVRYTTKDVDPDEIVSTIQSWDDYNVIVTPDLAVITGKLMHTRDDTGTNPFYQTFVLIKEDGEWKFIRGHGSHAW